MKVFAVAKILKSVQINVEKTLLPPISSRNIFHLFYSISVPSVHAARSIFLKLPYLPHPVLHPMHSRNHPNIFLWSHPQLEQRHPFPTAKLLKFVLSTHHAFQLHDQLLQIILRSVSSVLIILSFSRSIRLRTLRITSPFSG